MTGEKREVLQWHLHISSRAYGNICPCLSSGNSKPSQNAESVTIFKVKS